MHSLHLTELHYYLTTQDAIEYVWCALLPEQLDALPALPQHHGRVWSKEWLVSSGNKPDSKHKPWFLLNGYHLDNMVKPQSPM